MRLLLILGLLAGSLQAQSKKEFWTWTAISAATAIADVELTQKILSNPGSKELNPFLGSHPSRPRMYATVGVIDASYLFLGWKLRNRKLGRLFPVFVVGSHSFGIAYSATHRR